MFLINSGQTFSQALCRRLKQAVNIKDNTNLPKNEMRKALKMGQYVHSFPFKHTTIALFCTCLVSSGKQKVKL